MAHLGWSAVRRTRFGPTLLSSLVLSLACGGAAQAQEKIAVLPEKVATPAPVSAPAPLTLEQCIQFGYERQPALAAARASLAAAEDGRRALYNLGLAGLLARDLDIRKQQACHGVQIAQASLAQAEWETRYAVTRNYYTVLYVRLQQDVLNDIVKRLSKGKSIAEKLLKSGEVTKVTQIDVDTFAVNIDLLKLKQIEADVGVLKALSALREAIGIGCDFALDVAPDTLPPVVPALCKEELIRIAIANRGEIIQVTSANRVTELEVAAQAKKLCSVRNLTFAAGSDIHAKPIPQGVSNGEYRPGAIGLEMPPMLIGRRPDRVQRAQDLNARASAVVEKTYNLVSLEAENYYLKWLDAKEKLDQLEAVRPRVDDLTNRIEKRLENGEATGDEYIRSITLADQTRAQHNDALYEHALALAALERITAGGYRISPVVPHHP